jgi:hypothetical protein
MFCAEKDFIKKNKKLAEGKRKLHVVINNILEQGNFEKIIMT